MNKLSQKIAYTFILNLTTENRDFWLDARGTGLTAAEGVGKCGLIAPSVLRASCSRPADSRVRGACPFGSNCGSFRPVASHMQHNMAPASRAVVVVALSLLYLCRAIFSTEFFSTLTLFNNDLHKQGCSSLSEWEDYAADCGKVCLFAVTLPRPL